MPKSMSALNRNFIAISLFFAIGMMIALASVNAGSTQQFNNIHLTPYYYNSLPANTNQTFWININPPDNIGTVLSALFHFKTFTSGSSTNYTFYVNNKFCGYFFVSTTYANSGQNEVAFDCTSLVRTAGNYSVKLSSNVNTGAGFGWFDLTYMNNPATIETGGTEYLPNEQGRVFLRLLEGNSNPINLGNCNTTIYYPNNTKFLDNQQMALLERGYYYYDFITPNIAGAYIVGFDCIFPASTYFYNRTANYEIGAGNPTFSYEFNFDDTNNVTINSVMLLASVTGSGIGANNNYYFNSKYLTTLSGVNQFLNVTLNASYISLTDSQKIDIIRSALTSTVNWVSLYVNFTANNPSQIIRGQNEIHVTSLNSTLNQVCNFTNTNNMLTSVNDTIKNVNQSLSSQIVNVNQTWFDEKFNQTFLNQQTMYNYMQLMNSSVYGWFETTWNNQQTSYNYLIAMNTTMTTYYNNLTTSINELKSWIDTVISILS